MVSVERLFEDRLAELCSEFILLMSAADMKEILMYKSDSILDEEDFREEPEVFRDEEGDII